MWYADTRAVQIASAGYLILTSKNIANHRSGPYSSQAQQVIEGEHRGS